MRKKPRKCRQKPLRAMGDTPNANKENSFSNIFCRKGDVQNFRTKSAESATRSCPVGKKQSKKMKKEELALQRLQSSSEFLSSPSFKILSVSFFIPLNGYARGYQQDVPSIIDWSNLLFYGCNSATMLSYYPNEQVTKMYYYKPTVLPDLRLKCRTISESSTNSEDSFICFEHDDEKHHERCPVKLNECNFDDDDGVGTPNEYEITAKEKSSRKKKVRFVDTSELITVHLIIAWDYAYRAARVSQWETMARDSKRFKQKIRSLEPILSPVLSPEHRMKVWEKRMRDEV